MRIAVLIFALLGAAVAGFLGSKWLGDLAEGKASVEKMKKTMQDFKGLIDSPELDTKFKELASLERAAYLLVVAALVGLVMEIMVVLGKIPPKVAGAAMLLAVALPTVFQPKSLVFTFCLVIAGILALLAKSSGKAAGSGASSAAAD
jgi:uncharacterized protein involved in cysteine biosynthesis